MTRPLASIQPPVVPTQTGVWHRKGVVLYPDPTLTNPRLTGEPTVIVEGSPVVLTGLSTVFKMWYSNGGNTSIYYAESPDGVNDWTVYAGAGTLGAIINNLQRSFVIKIGSTYHLYGSPPGDARIDHYSSTDGVTFSLVSTGVVAVGNGAWNVGQNTNSSGVVISGTLYFFAEHTAIGIGLYTSTAASNYDTFTPVSLVIGSAYAGPSKPYQAADGTWWMWLHTLSNSEIQRWTAPAITGPWANSLSGFDFIQITPDEGISTGTGQVCDPYLVENGSKTYLYYSSNHFIGATAYSQVKCAIADMPMETLIRTRGGVHAGSIENLGALGLAYDYATNDIKTKNKSINLGSGGIKATTSGTQISVSGGFTVTNYFEGANYRLPANGYIGQNGSNFSLAFGSSTFVFKGLVSAVATDLFEIGRTTGNVTLNKGTLRIADTLTVATLPTAAAGNKGARTFVSDASAPTFGATVSGGGSTYCPVYSDGAAWKVG